MGDTLQGTLESILFQYYPIHVSNKVIVRVWDDGVLLEVPLFIPLVVKLWLRDGKMPKVMMT